MKQINLEAFNNVQMGSQAEDEREEYERQQMERTMNALENQCTAAEYAAAVAYSSTMAAVDSIPPSARQGSYTVTPASPPPPPGHPLIDAPANMSDVIAP